jgi:hypothetical protein
LCTVCLICIIDMESIFFDLFKYGQIRTRAMASLLLQYCYGLAMDLTMKSHSLRSVYSFASFLVALALLALPNPTRGEEPLLVTPVPPVLTAPAPVINSSSSLLPSTALSSGATNNVFSQPPTLAGRYTMNGSTVIPYIGLGFGGGETTDANRTAARQSVLQSSAQQDRLLNDVLGKSLVPNEFQVGIRIPF